MGCCGGKHSKPTEEPPVRIYLLGICSVALYVLAGVSLFMGFKDNLTWFAIIPGALFIGNLVFKIFKHEASLYESRRISGRPKR